MPGEAVQQHDDRMRSRPGRQVKDAQQGFAVAAERHGGVGRGISGVIRPRIDRTDRYDPRLPDALAVAAGPAG
ncbi:hypothetical protein GCM10027612_62320 [Microbispora bryophytorum subsp. camponoti]